MEKGTEHAEHTRLEAVGVPRQEFLGSVGQSLPTLMLIDVWQWTPMMTLLLLAGLTTLPEEPEEAALVDGANGWQRFRHVVLPMLGPTSPPRWCCAPSTH